MGRMTSNRKWGWKFMRRKSKRKTGCDCRQLAEHDRTRFARIRPRDLAEMRIWYRTLHSSFNNIQMFNSWWIFKSSMNIDVKFRAAPIWLQFVETSRNALRATIRPNTGLYPSVSTKRNERKFSQSLTQLLRLSIFVHFSFISHLIGHNERKFITYVSTFKITTLEKPNKWGTNYKATMKNIMCLNILPYQSTRSREADFSSIAEIITVWNLFIWGMNPSHQGGSLYLWFCLFLSTFCILMSE
jgi:hypothetical protein